MTWSGLAGAALVCVPSENFVHYVRVGVGSLACRVLGIRLVCIEWLLSHGKRGNAVSFEAAPPHHRATHYLVHMSPAAKLKHRPVFDLLERFADGYISSSKCRPVCKLSIIKNSSEMRDNVDVHSISRFRWVCTSCERHSALEVLASLTHQPTNSPAVSTAVVGCHDFIESLGRALPKAAQV